MNDEFIKSASDKYKLITKVFCPYFKKEVECTSRGFRHLIYKADRIRRSTEEVKVRLKSLDYLVEILENSGTVQEVEVLENGQMFYGFIAVVNSKKYKVVVSGTVDGRFLFRSIIPRWKTNKRDKKLKNLQSKNSSSE